MGEVAEKIIEDIENREDGDIEIEKGEDISEKIIMETKLMIDYFSLSKRENITNIKAKEWITKFAIDFDKIWKSGERDIDRIKNELYGDLNK